MEGHRARYRNQGSARRTCYYLYMSVIYHGVPEHMEGRSLLPLNQMATSHPELHTQYLKKYEGREEIMQKKIPLLECLWNDVVQFLPLNPIKIFELQVELGFIPNVPSYQFYKIELSQLNSDKTVVYFKSAPGEENVTVKWLRDVDFAALQEIPEATVQYYESLIGSGELPFNYQFIPHILYMGELDIANSDVMTIS
jgi:hypothetical protein